MDDARSGDPRDDACDGEKLGIRWVTLDREPTDSQDVAVRDREADSRERERDGHDPRDVFTHDLDLPHADERELVLDRDQEYHLDRETTRTLASTGAFRVIADRDLPSNEARKAARDLREQGLVRQVSISGRDRGITLTDCGRRLLERHRRDRDGRDRQRFHAGVNNPREIKHDAALYRAYRDAEQRIRERGADVRRVVLETDLKREYQQFLQEHNRNRPDSDGRPDRDEREIQRWAHEHDLPVIDGSVQFPDFRIEYEIHGREEHEDIEVVTAHYRGAHAASRVQAGFTCYSESGRRGGAPFDPHLAERML